MYYRRDIMYSSERMVQPNSLLSKWRFRARNAVHGWPGLLSLLSGRRIDAVVPERTPLRAKVAAPTGPCVDNPNSKIRGRRRSGKKV